MGHTAGEHSFVAQDGLKIFYRTYLPCMFNPGYRFSKVPHRCPIKN